MANSFFDIFKKYSPPEREYRLLAQGHDVSVRYSRDPFRVEVRMDFDNRVDAGLLYAIEEQCKELYNAVSFRIFPHFPPHTFSVDCMGEIITEAVRVGAVAHGFFDDAYYYDDGTTVTAEIPFLEGGVGIVNDSGTCTIISNIIRDRYCTDRKVKVVSSGDAASATAEREEKLRRHEAEIIRESIANAELRRAASVASSDAPAVVLPREYGMGENSGVAEQLGPFLYRVGSFVYDTDEAEVIMGERFTISEPTAIGAITGPRGNTVVLGTVFEVTKKENRRGDRITLNIGITDGTASGFIHISGSPEDASVGDGISPGQHLAVSCKVTRDRFDENELNLVPYAIARISRRERMDEADERRVELHLHTNMSAMDALIRPDELLATAVRWGHKAIAVTDHGNVQAFPELLKVKSNKKLDIKILYGIEGYLVDDTARAIYGPAVPGFDDEIVVFDIETTGLSATKDKIIEIGAVLVRAGEIVETYDTFVNPHMELSEETTGLTSITTDMVRDARDISEVLPEFMSFVGDRMLVAHNANFDCGFIRAAAEQLGIPFSNTYLDTLALSRYVNPELKSHKLDRIVDLYGLGDFHHHRASDDALVLAKILFTMQSRLRDEGINDFQSMITAMSEKSDPLKLKTYHVVIFARNLAGLKNLYELVSEGYLTYFKRFPRFPKSLIERLRDGLLIGSACESGELYQAILENMSDAAIEDIASFYDYLEIQPLCNNRFLIDKQLVSGDEELKHINRRIVQLGKKLGKLTVATCDAHFLNSEDEILRKMLLKGMKMQDGDRDCGLYLRTTDEMLDEFEYLGEELAYEVVVKNTNLIADMIEDIKPVPDGTYTPSIPGAEEDLTRMCYERAHSLYGDPLPELVEQRLDRELTSIIKHGFAVLYMIAQKLVAYSESQGYLVGSRGSVGSSFVASMAGISEVNPLPPHYRCPACRYNEFITDGSVGSGFDMPDKKCPQCGAEMLTDGHDIPFETFLGFKGDKSPDIDLNFSGDVQGRVHKYTEELFGEGHVFRAGTIGTLASKTAYGYVMKYLEEKQISLPRAHVNYLVSGLVGVKKTTGQHPGGIIVVPTEYSIYDFSPVQHPADDPDSDIITTHFQFSYLHDTILKLDELGHDIPTKYKMLERYTDTSVNDVKMNDPKVYKLFESTEPLGISPEDAVIPLGTLGLPELGTHFVVGVIQDAKPKNFADLLQVSGLTHGTDVWLGNAKDLIMAGVCDISKVVGTRDSIMLTLLRYGVESSMSFNIMEGVRKGKGLKPDQEAAMRAADVPDWYIDSCKKIKYMFPKAHAAAYVMSAIRLGWYKINYPKEFYAAYLSVAPGGFDAGIVSRGRSYIKSVMDELEKKGTEATQKEAEQFSALQLALEAIIRGIKFLPIDLYKSDATFFLPEEGGIRMPFNSVSGLGDSAAVRIVEARESGEFMSVEDLRGRTKLSLAVIETLRSQGVLSSLAETNQIDLFSLM